MQGRVRVGQDALSRLGLIYGYETNNVLTRHTCMNRAFILNTIFEAYHFRDTAYLLKLDDGSYTPTAERALIDCMTWQTKNHDEGMLIEALQNYQRMGHKPEDLYECADHYNLDHIVVNYWWKEALEESNMSMG